MKTTSRDPVSLRVIARCAIAAWAILGMGCDNSHFLGAVDSGPPASDAGLPGTDGAIVQDSGPPPAHDAGGEVRQIGPLGATQSWTGYIENYQFTSGSDAVKIAFAYDDGGQVVGTVILGNGTPPPPAADPNVGYPPGYGATFSGPIGFNPSYVAEGYAYTMRNGMLTGRRLQFGVTLNELWEGWCALQTPIPGSSSCLPNWGGMYSPTTGCAQLNPATNQYVSVDCGKLSLCFGPPIVCQCDASSCWALEDNVDIRFDVSIASDAADGSIAGITDHNVHFTKDP